MSAITRRSWEPLEGWRNRLATRKRRKELTRRMRRTLEQGITPVPLWLLLLVGAVIGVVALARMG